MSKVHFFEGENPWPPNRIYEIQKVSFRSSKNLFLQDIAFAVGHDCSACFTMSIDSNILGHSSVSLSYQSYLFPGIYDLIRSRCRALVAT